MPEEPSGADLLTEVAKALRAGIRPGFDQKVAANAIELALRESALGSVHASEEAVRLRALIGRDGSLAELNAALCDVIRQEQVASNDPALLRHLKATASARMAIDQPAYPALATIHRNGI